MVNKAHCVPRRAKKVFERAMERGHDYGGHGHDHGVAGMEMDSAASGFCSGKMPMVM